MGATPETPDYELEEIDIDLLKIPDWDIRSSRDEEEILSLAASMEDEGQIMPIIVGEVDDHMYEIIDGVHRYIAADRLGWNTLNALVLKSDKNEYKVGVIANMSRVQVSKEDKFRIFQYLYNEVGMTVAEVADEIGISERQAHDYKKSLDLSPDMIEMVLDNEIPIKVSAALARIPDPEVRYSILDRGITRDYGNKTLLEQAKNAKRRVTAKREVKKKKQQQKAEEQEQADQRAQTDEPLSTESASVPADDSGDDSGANSGQPHTEEAQEVNVDTDEAQVQESSRLDSGEKSGSDSDQDQADDSSTSKEPSAESAPKPNMVRCHSCTQEVRKEMISQFAIAPEMAQRIGIDQFLLCPACGQQVMQFIGDLQEELQDNDQEVEA